MWMFSNAALIWYAMPDAVLTALDPAELIPEATLDIICLPSSLADDTAFRKAFMASAPAFCAAEVVVPDPEVIPEPISLIIFVPTVVAFKLSTASRALCPAL